MSEFSSAKASAGLSLLELLVSLAITAVLLGGVAAISQRAQASYASSHEQIELQTQSKRALERIALDVRSAGFVGCVRFYEQSFRSAEMLGEPDPHQSVWGFHAGEAIGTDEWLKLVVPGTDVLFILGPQGAAQTHELEQPIILDSTQTIAIGENIGVGPGDWLMIYDCKQRAYLRVVDYAHGSIRYDQMLLDSVVRDSREDESFDQSALFDTDAKVRTLQVIAYFVAPSSSGESSSLWRTVRGHTPQEISKSVNGMHLRFGSNSNPPVPSNGVQDWAAINLVSATLELGGAGSNRRTISAAFAVRNRS